MIPLVDRESGIIFKESNGNRHFNVSFWAYYYDMICDLNFAPDIVVVPFRRSGAMARYWVPDVKLSVISKYL